MVDIFFCKNCVPKSAKKVTEHENYQLLRQKNKKKFLGKNGRFLTPE
jgi:hypothetical protein